MILLCFSNTSEQFHLYSICSGIARSFGLWDELSQRLPLREITNLKKKSHLLNFVVSVLYFKIYSARTIFSFKMFIFLPLDSAVAPIPPQLCSCQSGSLIFVLLFFILFHEHSWRTLFVLLLCNFRKYKYVTMDNLISYAKVKSK